MFNRNDYVFYPGHGVAVVDDIVQKTVSGSTLHFLKLTFLFKDMCILVPTYNSDSIGLRMPSPCHVVQSAMDELLKKPERRLDSIDFTPSGWNRRFKDYQSKIQCGKILDIAKMYRDLMYIAQQKDLSFGERTILQSTEDLLAQEVQVVLAIDRGEVIQMIRNPFKQLSFHDPLSNKQQEAQI